MKISVLKIFILSLFFAISPDLKSAELKGIKFFKDAAYVSIDIRGVYKVRSGFLPSSIKKFARFYLDLLGVEKASSFCRRLKLRTRGVLKKVRCAQNTKKRLRVVFEIDHNRRLKYRLDKKVGRLLIFLPGFEHRNKLKNNKAMIIKKKKKIIVIDPGHGGKDPGAVIGKRTFEKDFTLSLSKALCRHINKLKGKFDYKCVLTRNSDKYLPLKRRIKIANEKSGDLFLSLHLNSSHKKNVFGFEVYYLNTVTNKYAKNLVARENKDPEIDQVDLILTELTVKTYVQDSIRIAKLVSGSYNKSFKERNFRIKNLGVKNALFYVLMGANMPSLLVELGFISNSKERSLLEDSKYRKILLGSIAKAVRRFFDYEKPSLAREP